MRGWTARGTPGLPAGVACCHSTAPEEGSKPAWERGCIALADARRKADGLHGPETVRCLLEARRSAEEGLRTACECGFGAFHIDLLLLRASVAHMALRRALPEDVSPAQVRGAMTALIRRTLDAPETFDADGWLRIGFCGHQPGIGETYISTGSLYLCAVAFLPLGLSPTDPFWSAPAQPWTSVRAWSGQPFPIDHAIAT